MATPKQHFAGIDVKLGEIDAELTAKVPIPVNGGTFNPALIDLSQGQIEYDAYTQTGPVTLSLHPDLVPVIGSTVAVNIMGGGFSISWSSPFLGVEGAEPGMLLAAGISHPLMLRYMVDWEQITPGVYANRVLVGVMRNALGLFRGGGSTVNQVAGAPATPYEFTAGGALVLDPLNPKHRSIKVLGPGDGLLTANMQVTLQDPDLYDEGSEHYVEKGDSSAFTVTVFGFDLLETGTHTLRRQDQFIVAKIAGKTSKKWERQKGGQQNPSGFGQDLVKASNAATANLLLGTATVIQTVTAAQAIAGVTLVRQAQRLLVELTEDLNSDGTFVLPTISVISGDSVGLVRHGGGLGNWSRTGTGADSSDVLRARDDILEYTWNGAAWVRILARSQQVVRVSSATYTVSGADHLVDLVFNTTPCTVILPNSLGTRTRFRLVQQGSAIATLSLASGTTLMPSNAATATTGDGTALVLTVVQNATGTAALYRVVLEPPLPATGTGGGLSPEDEAKLDSIAFGAGSSQPGIPFSTDLTLADADHGLRYEWIGTVARRVTVPTGLSEGVTVEIVAQSATANLAPLIVERVSGDQLGRKGWPIGCRVLSPGGRVIIRKEGESAPRIWGDLDPAAMAAQNGGASFLLELGARQGKSGSVLTSWGDRYGLHDFEQGSGAATVGGQGEVIFDCVDGADVTINGASANFSGSGVLFGICFKVVSITMTTNDKTWLNLGGYAEGIGWYFGTGNPAGAGTTPASWFMNIMRDSAPTPQSTTLFNQSYNLGQPVALAVAILPSASNGYAYGFSDEGYSNRQRGYVKTGLSFTKAGGWPSVAFAPSFGPILGTGDNMKFELYALTIRDGLAFASQDEARDQADAMLAEMRGYA